MTANAGERRKSMRFLEERRVVVTTRVISRSELIRSMVTRDFSSGGAFLLTTRRSPVGTGMHVQMALALRSIQGIVDLELDARVVRIEPLGMAVRFEQGYLRWRACGELLDETRRN